MISARSGNALFFLGRIADLVRGSPVVCSANVRVADVARAMLRARVGSVLVTGANGEALGIITDRDLRRKVVAEGRDPASTCAAEIMSTPLVTIRAGAFVFEAVLEMTRREIHHLVVTDEGRPVGVVSSSDVLAAQTANPVALAREIGLATSLEALAALGARVIGLAQQLVDDGARTYDIAQLVSELNDRTVVRVLALARGGLEASGAEAPPVAHCWLSFGSEARREQTLRTDQDNGLVFADPPPALRELTTTYYSRLAEETVRGLVRIGVPPCPGGIMASNPRWCQPFSVWRGYFRRWMAENTPAQVLDASIHFDLRPLAGAVELGESLASLLRHEAPQHRTFLRLLASDVVERRLPLRPWGHVRLARTGPHRGALDLKGAGTMQLVGAGRVHALELGLGETNTIDRFRAAQGHGLYSAAETGEIVDAAQHLMRLRLRHQLGQHARGETPDNFVSPAHLSHADQVLLREALRTVRRVQAAVRERFATSLVPR